MTDLPKVDSNEVEALWFPLVEAGWLRERLPSADFSLPAAGGKLAGIERKTVLDFLASMQETPEERKHNKGARLVRQAMRMMEDYDYAGLIIELGTAGSLMRQPNGLMPCGEPWDSFMDKLLTVQELGLTWEFTFGVGHTVQRLKHLRARYLKFTRSHVQRALAHDPQVAALSLTPGIGEKKAKALVEAGIKLHLADHLTGFTVRYIADLPGFGKATAEKIVRFWS